MKTYSLNFMLLAYYHMLIIIEIHIIIKLRVIYTSYYRPLITSGRIITDITDVAKNRSWSSII